ncbi:MAG: urea carboxylase-associated family protein [Burkholderiaceae bacterium]
MSQPAVPTPPADAAARRAAPPVVCYEVQSLPPLDWAFYQRARSDMRLVRTLRIEPRDALAFEVPAGSIFRILSIEGPQVGDLNLWHATDLAEHFYSGKTRQLHATHVGIGDRLWSNLPALRPMATITADTLGWYGFDADGAGVHDVIGTRCDPHTNRLLRGLDYHHCCH